MAQSSLIDSLFDLGKSGCQGNPGDYLGWLRFAGAENGSESSIASALEDLVGKGIFKRNPDTSSEFQLAAAPTFPSSIEYEVSGNLNEAPIQMVRSRLEAFLKHHGAKLDEIIDIAIATTEAMENAVKYSDQRPIKVSYHVDGRTFHIKIVNSMREIKPEADIEAGKYSSSYTLMRGMMVMVKLFDDMGIDISEERNEAVFTAHKLLAS